MIVLLEPEVFVEASPTDLMVLLWLGATGRHRIAVLDEKAPAYIAWLRQQDEVTRDEWQRVVGESILQHVREPSYYEILIVARGDSTWSYPSPILTVVDAIDLLLRPYRVLVENGFSDRAFLLSMCDRATREFIEEWCAREWVEIEHCGGNDHLEKRAKEARKHVGTRMRHSAIFDGDGMRPRSPSAKSMGIRDLCYPDVHHHQLERRAIENYLPRAALERWVKLAQGQERRQRAAQVAALFALSADQRAHYNMKGGFADDVPNARRAGDLFNGLAAEMFRLLDGGLDKKIAKLYQDDSVLYHELEQTDSIAKVQSFAREIVERIR